MTFASYHSAITSNVASEGAVGTTSSQILLYREIADTSSSNASISHPPTSTFVMSIFESGSRHIMTLGEAAASSASSASPGLDGEVEECVTRC